MRIDAENLNRFCCDLLIRVGLSPSDAAIVADSLVEANLRGVDTHGVVRLPIYVKRIRLGLIERAPTMEISRTTPSTATFDGGNGPGQVVTVRAMDEAIGMARDTGVGLVAVRRSNHFGAAAYFAMRALEHDMIGIALTHAESDVIPFGGREPRLGTNPLAFAVPAGTSPPIVLDMATSVVAMGAVLLAAQEGRTIPKDWAVDADGNPVTDPGRARAVRPMAGPKGYGLAVIIDVFCALLTGSAFGVHINRMYDNFSEPQAIGHFVGAIDIRKYVPVREFKERIDQMIRELKATPAAEGFDEVLLPGEPEARCHERRLREGVPLSREVYDELANLGEELRVAIELDDNA